MRVDPVTEAEFERVLPLIADYQRFYEVEDVSEERNRAFFRRFIFPSDDGLMLAAWNDEDDPDEAAPLGYACLYWFFSSTRAAETVLMNDLFVTPEARGQGVGRGLIDAGLETTRKRGAAHLEWATAPDNKTAQRLYDSTGAEQSTWLTYEIAAAAD